MISDDELGAMAASADQATPGPWFTHATDDEYSSNALYVSTIPGSKEQHDNRRGMADGDPFQATKTTVVAITLLQKPFLCLPNECEENTEFIANARTDVPRLIIEVRRLKKRLKELGVSE
jgi:hypothetical protein